MSHDDEKLLDHDYDGIRELDNPLPAWWLATFFVTIIFGFHYWIHYEILGGPTLKQELAQDLAVIESTKKVQPVKEVKDEELKELLASAAKLNEGQSVYAAKCGACHGAELQGLIGPNLTDAHWLHGKGGFADVVGVIRSGVLEKGMPAWAEQMKDDEIRKVAAFILSRKGSNPPNAKPPQGEKVGDL